MSERRPREDSPTPLDEVVDLTASRHGAGDTPRDVFTLHADGLAVTAGVRDGTFEVVLEGEVDFATTRQSRTGALLDVYRSLDPLDIVVDLAGVTFLDSGGLSWLVRLRAAALARGRHAVLRSPSEHCSRVLLLSGVVRLFPGEEFERPASGVVAADGPGGSPVA